MLVSANRLIEAGAELHMHLCLEPSLSVVYMRQRGLRYDGRFQPSCRARSRGRVSLYILLSGELATSNGLEASTPALFRLPEDVLEGANGARSATLRLSGEPLVSIAMHLDPRRVPGPVGLLPERLPLSPEVERAARTYSVAIDGGVAADTALAPLVSSLVGDGLLSAHDEAPAPLARMFAEKIWSALSTRFAALDTAPTITMLADLAGVSPRTTDRLMKQFTDVYGLPQEGLRELSLRWRLKLATLLLSNPALSVRRVAELVGYRNAEALANALSSEGLPSPSVYRQL